MGGTKNALVGKLERKDYSENQGLDGRIILKWISEKYGGKMTGCILPRIGTSSGDL
jgi:hypothetical protein